MNYRLKIPLLWLMLLTFNMAQAQTDIFYESFDENSYTGGNDGQWSGSVASGGTVSTDNEDGLLTQPMEPTSVSA